MNLFKGLEKPQESTILPRANPTPLKTAVPGLPPARGRMPKLFFGGAKSTTGVTWPAPAEQEKFRGIPGEQMLRKAGKRGPR